MQSRPLEPMYPVAFFDALRVKIRADGLVRNKAVYLALGVLPDGSRDILGLWIENTEGAKFWMKVFNDLKTRGVHDILIAVTDGLQGREQALGAVFPKTTLQTCIVHLIRRSLDYANSKDRKALAAALKPVYTAPGAEAAASELNAFDEGDWGRRYPTVAAAWQRVWERVIPFFTFPPAVRKVIYTTHALESVNAGLSKIIRTRGHFPSDEAATNAAMAGAAQHHCRLDAHRTRLEGRHESIHDTVRGALHAPLTTEISSNRCSLRSGVR
ncbi:transposase [Pandoraea sputorum]|nr:IS256 family transposase [Pandoraea sputorum]VVE59367.1 transposase [Pandoraea sputorum]